jgi:hypothetical protein
LWLVGLRYARIRSLRSATLPSPANPRKSLSWARFIGSGNVVGGHPLGASFTWLMLKRFCAIHGAKNIIKENMSILENNIPAIVYHYCSLDIMEKILKSQYLLCSIHSSMKDFTDSSWWYHLLKTRAMMMIKPENEEKINEFLRHILINSHDYYLACFSKKNNILSQ